MEILESLLAGMMTGSARLQASARNPLKKKRKRAKPLPCRSEARASLNPRANLVTRNNALAALKQELADLPSRIEKLEAEQHQLGAAMADPAFYQRDSAEISRDAARLKELEDELAMAYARWEELEQG